MAGNDVGGDPGGCVAAAAAAAQAVAAATNTGCSVSSSNTTPTSGMITTIDLSSASSSVGLVGPGGSVVVQTSGAGSVAGGSSSPKEMPKRLHVSNIPFRFRDPDLRAMFGVCIHNRNSNIPFFVFF